MKGLKKMTMNIMIFILIIASISLYKYQSVQDRFSCEHNTNMSCRSFVFPANCKKGQEVFPWLFQTTWFIKPERGVENFGAIFDNETGQFWHPGEKRDGSYCIDDKTIIFKNDKPDKEIEKIEIISINETEMVLEFEDGALFTYYNPESKAEISPESLKTLNKSMPIKDIE
jgi:hypothetical protein